MKEINEGNWLAWAAMILAAVFMVVITIAGCDEEMPKVEDEPELIFDYDWGLTPFDELDYKTTIVFTTDNITSEIHYDPNDRTIYCNTSAEDLAKAMYLGFSKAEEPNFVIKVEFKETEPDPAFIEPNESDEDETIFEICVCPIHGESRHFYTIGEDCVKYCIICITEFMIKKLDEAGIPRVEFKENRK